MALVTFVNDSAPYLNAENLNNNFEYLDEKKDEYSTSETLTNKVWIDGKPIYRKVIQSGAISLTTTLTNINTGVSNIENMIDIHFMYKFVSGKSWFKMWNLNNLGWNYDTNKIFISTDQSASFDDSFIILEYTKTTD